MKSYKTPQEYINFIYDELENANNHNCVELPEKLFNRIKHLIKKEDELDLIRIISEEFYKNI